MKSKSALRSFLVLVGSSLFAVSSAHAQSTYTWDNSNVTGTPVATLDWFTGGSNSLGLWTGPVVPVSSNLNTIQFFQNTTTALTNTGPSTQISNINNGGSAFQLGTLTLNGLGSATTGRPLTMTISGDALNFSAATGTINLNAIIGTGTSNITYNLDSAIRLGTASSAGALTIAGNGTGVFNIGGGISELQTGGGSLTKSGTSTVSLNNANTYTGRTTISQGVLLLNHATALPGGIGSTGGTSNLSFNGTGTNITVLGLGNGNFERSLGANTVAGAVTFTGNGGWAAYGADRTVNLGGAGAQITWASANTGFNAKSLVLGAANATHTVTLENDLDLGSSARTVITGEGSAAIDGKMSGNIIGTGGLTKTGAGTLALSGTNTYSGTTTVGAGFPSPAQLIFQGKQAVSPNTTFNTRQNSGSTARLVFLDDSAGVINLGNSWTFNAENRGDNTANAYIFVGNNSTGNGGNNASSTQTGSTIALGGFISAPSSIYAPVGETINITGANGYKLQLASIAFPNLTSKPSGINYTMTMNPTTAPVIVAGGVTPFASGNTNSTPIIDLGGTTTGNEIQGVIANPSNVGTSNPLRLTKSSTSTWTLSGANTYTGGTTVSGGTLGFVSGALGSTGTINASGGTLLWLAGNTQDISSRLAMTAATTSTFNTNGNNVTFATGIGSATTGGLSKTGLGSLTLGGTNNYSGATTLSGGGTLVLDYGASDTSKLSDTTNGLILGGGTLTLKGDNTKVHEEIVTSTSVNSGGTFLTRDGANTAKLRMNAITRAAGGTVSFGDATIATTDTNNFGTSGANGILGGWATLGSNWAVSANTGSADTAITALGSYTTFVAVGAGGSATANYQLTGNHTRTAAVAAGTMRISDNGAGQSLNLANFNLTITSTSATALGGILYAGGSDNNYTIGNGGGTGRIVTSTTNQEVIFNAFTGTTLTVDAFVGLSGSIGPVTKSGIGTLVLGAANNYTGITRVNEGTLRLTNNTGAGTATNTLNNGIIVQNGAALELASNVVVSTEALTLTGTGLSNAGALRNMASSVSTYGGAITLGSGGARINSDNTGVGLTLTGGVTTSLFNNVTFGGAGNTTVETAAITGAGGLIKDGIGTTTLSFANTYTGATTVNEGKLLINGSTSSSSAVTVANGATLGGSGVIGGSVTVQAGGTFSPGNSIESIASGDLSLLSGAVFAQEIDKSVASNISGDLAVVTGSLNITSGANLTLAELGTSGTWGAGDKITLIGYSTGTWNNGLLTYLGNTLNDDSTINFSGIDWVFDYNDITFGDNYQSDMSAFNASARYVTMTAVPETSTALLSGLGALTLLRRRRK